MLSAHIRVYAIAHPSLRPSVRYMGGSYKTGEFRIIKFSPYGSPTPLVFAGRQTREWWGKLEILTCDSIAYMLSALYTGWAKLSDTILHFCL